MVVFLKIRGTETEADWWKNMKFEHSYLSSCFCLMDAMSRSLFPKVLKYFRLSSARFSLLPSAGSEVSSQSVSGVLTHFWVYSRQGDSFIGRSLIIGCSRLEVILLWSPVTALPHLLTFRTLLESIPLVASNLLALLGWVGDVHTLLLLYHGFSVVFGKKVSGYAPSAMLNQKLLNLFYDRICLIAVERLGRDV